MSQCSVCRGYGHPSAVHTATCVVCGKAKPPLSFAALRNECDESPFRKGYFVYHCGDTEAHAALARYAEKLPGDPDAPKVRAPKLVKGEKEALRTLF